MSKRRFYIVLALCLLGLLLASVKIPGAMIGFYFGIAIAFFVAPATFGLEALASEFGIDFDKAVIIKGLMALYGIYVLVTFWMAWRSYAREDMDAARKHAARGVILVSLAVGAWLSSQALIRAWPN